MSQGPPNLKPDRFRWNERYRRRLVLIAIAALLGAGAYYLTSEQFRADLLHGRDAAVSSAAAPVDAEPGYASAEDAGIPERQSRSLAPGQPARLRHSLPERDSVSDAAGDPSQSEGDDRPSRAGEDAPAEQQGDGDDDPEEDPELAISGAVLDDRGALMPDVTVNARPVGPPGRSNSQASPLDGALSQVTDNLGSFVFEPLVDGEYRLSVADSDAFHGVELRVRAGVSNAELRVQRIREVRVHGWIIDEHGGAMENVRVRDLGGSRAQPSDIGGAYEIIVAPVKPGLAPVLEFRHPGYRSQRKRVEAIVGSDADAVRLDVEMQPSGEQVAVLGHVSGPRGEPVPDVDVWLSSADPRQYLGTRSNQGGEFEFDQVELGDAYRLGVDPGPDYRKYVSDAFEVGPGNTAHDVRLEADGHGRLSGRLVDPEGGALGRFTVWLRSRDSAGGHPAIPVTSDAAGNFEVEQVPAGALRLESTSQPRLQAVGIELRPGEARHLEVPLDWGERWMFGKVTDADDRPIAGARVTLQWSRQHYDVVSSSHRRAATDVEGFFSFSNLGARDYSVTVQAPGFQTRRRSYALGSDDLVIVLQSIATAGGGQ